MTAENFTGEDLRLVEELEGYKAIRRKGRAYYLFESEYDTRIIENLPRGIKILLYIRHITRTVKKGQTASFHVSACGSRILEKIFEAVDDTELSLYLRHTDVAACRDREYRVNRRKADTAARLKELLTEELEKDEN